MTREKLIKKTLERLSKLPDHQVREVSDFTEFLLNRLEEERLNQGIQYLSAESKSFQFLEEEEELYTLEDLKEVYNEKG